MTARFQSLDFLRALALLMGVLIHVLILFDKPLIVNNLILVSLHNRCWSTCQNASAFWPNFKLEFVTMN